MSAEWIYLAISCRMSLYNDSSFWNTLFTTNTTANGSQLSEEDLLYVIANFHNSLYRYREPNVIVLITLYVIVFVLALVDNGIAVIVLLSMKQNGHPTKYFCLNMAIADLLVAVICIPVAVVQVTYDGWLLGSFMCKATPYLQGVAVCASVMTITLLGLDRMTAIRFPILARRVFSVECTKFCIPFIWLLALVVMIPRALVKHLDHEIFQSQAFSFCSEHWSSDSNKRAYSIFILCFVYLIPGAILIVAYAIMGRHLWKQSSQYGRRGSVVSITGRPSTERRRVARTSILLATIFAICWFPYYVISMLFDAGYGTTTLSRNGLHYALLLGHGNSIINPILYCFMGSAFRKQLKYLLCYHRRSQPAAQFSQDWRRESINENGLLRRLSTSSMPARRRSTQEDMSPSSQHLAVTLSHLYRPRNSSPCVLSSSMKLGNHDHVTSVSFSANSTPPSDRQYHQSIKPIASPSPERQQNNPLLPHSPNHHKNISITPALTECLCQRDMPTNLTDVSFRSLRETVL